jgi:hypothetical protein
MLSKLRMKKYNSLQNNNLKKKKNRKPVSEYVRIPGGPTIKGALRNCETMKGSFSKNQSMDKSTVSCIKVDNPIKFKKLLFTDIQVSNIKL